MINFFAGLFALAFGFGLAFWICGTELDKSNNIGDSRGDGAAYKAEATFTSKCDRMEQSAYRTFVQQNIIDNVATNRWWLHYQLCSAVQEQVRRLTEEERRKKAEAEKKSNVPKGAFVSKNTSAASDTYDMPDWEKRVGDQFIDTSL